MSQGVAADQAGIPMDTKPIGDQIVNRSIGVFANYFNLDLLGLSVYLSIVSLVLFVIAIYCLSLTSLRHRGWALFIAAVSIIPIHALGGTTFGFRALGFLPRDLALGITIGTLTLYVYSVQKKRLRLTYVAFCLCGLFANYYSIAFVHLFVIMSLAEIIRARKITRHHFGFAAVWVVAALPAIGDLIGKTNTWAPVDLEIMRMRNGFMIAAPISIAAVQYLRRFIIHGILCFIGIALVRNFSDESTKNEMGPWIPLAVSSLIIAVAGLIVEANTEYLRMFFSRASQVLTIASMLFTVAGLRALATHLRVKAPNLAVVSVAGFLFLFQSNVGTILRFWKGLERTRIESEQFFEAVEMVKAVTPSSAIIMAPSPIINDLAASLRTYANRRIYVAYKDGGVSLVDGHRAREWWARYQRQNAVLDTQDPDVLGEFLSQEGIDFVFLPDDLDVVQKLGESKLLEKVASTNGFIVLKRSNKF